MNTRPGQIVSFRNRLWRVDDIDEVELTATAIDSEILGKRKFLLELEDIKPAQLNPISASKTGDIAFQELLLRSYRFDLLHGSAPFLSLQRSSVIPYNYQLVPLVLALEKAKTRLLIADDVGLGKTVEAGLIMSELQQRGRVKRVLILTPAHLKEQWEESLRYFFHIESQIISSFSRKEFEKKLPSGANPWQFFSHCIASIDYAKAPETKHLILEQDWDMVLVDEVHLCARPHAMKGHHKQMLRYELIRDLGAKVNNILFLTATPHNGYSDSFASLLEILNPQIVLNNNGEYSFQKQIAKHNVCQRNRRKLDEWFVKNGKTSPFPSRNAIEIEIGLNEKMANLINIVAEYGDELINKNYGKKKELNIASWVALHFQKRAISSPFALKKSLENRLQGINQAQLGEKDPSELSSQVSDQETDERITEEIANNKLDVSLFDVSEEEVLEYILKKASEIKPKDDVKLNELKATILPELFNIDRSVVVFTKYKDTLDYLIANLQSDEYQLLEMHGEMSLKKRQEILLELERSDKALLIATDVISEGINLQRMCSNIIHYELPWNPNRLEQRNGRIDRIGQLREEVNIRTLILKDSLDIQILEHLIKKAETIRGDRGYSAAYFGDESSLNDLILRSHAQHQKERKKKAEDKNQLNLFGTAEDKQYLDRVIEKQIKDPYALETVERIQRESFYDSIDISLPDIDKRIQETQRVVGSKEEVKTFVESAMRYFGCLMDLKPNGFYKLIVSEPKLKVRGVPEILKKVSFDPEDGIAHPEVTVLELGHPLIRKMIELVKTEFFSEEGKYGRNAGFYSDQVDTVTVIYNALVRYSVGRTEKRVIEELITFGYDTFDQSQISPEKLITIKPTMTTDQIDGEEFKHWLSEGLSENRYSTLLNKEVEQRRQELISESQELAKKVYRETKSDEDAKWVDEIMFIDTTSVDLLTITIVWPN